MIISKYRMNGYRLARGLGAPRLNALRYLLFGKTGRYKLGGADRSDYVAELSRIRNGTNFLSYPEQRKEPDMTIYNTTKLVRQIIWVSVFALWIVMIALGSRCAHASSLLVYRPYVTEQYDCTYLESGGSSSSGYVVATCFEPQRFFVADYVFTSTFDEGMYADWEYDVTFNNTHHLQARCSMIYTSSVSVILSCP